MATSADRDDRDEDEKDKDEAPPKKTGGAAGPAKAAPAKAADAGKEDDDEDEEDDEEDKPASKSTKVPAKAAARDEEEDDEPAPKRPAVKGPGARSGRGPGAARRPPATPAGGGSLGKSVLLFFVIVILLGAGFAILGRETPPEQAKPKWTQGQVVDVEVTLVRSDRQDLACAAADEIGGKHCAFEAINKPWSKGGDVNDDKKLLKPYTTVEHVQFAAAGLWSDPALAADKLPATRFSVKCKYKVEGTLKSVGVRWEQTGQWYPNNEWYAGTLSDCKLAP